jgi:8-oxo-dGTP pyrophosphatase MutT (NUDIX family)
MQVYGAICVDPSGNVLLVRGRLSKKWSFPKGHRKYNETSLECALRELYEETGIRPVGNYTSMYKMKGGKYFVFNIDSNVEICINDTVEINAVEWFPLNKLPLIATNIDVSLFRSHIKQAFPSSSCFNIKSLQNYIGTPNSLRSINNIQSQLNRPSSPRGFGI